jgi:hypothetical protein
MRLTADALREIELNSAIADDASARSHRISFPE